MHARSLALVLALSAAALPSASRAQTGGSRPFGAALIGVEADGDSGLALRFDAGFPLRPLGPSVGFALLGSVGFSHFSRDQIVFFNERWKTTTNVFRIAPAVRFTFGGSQVLKPYADAGLGLYIASADLHVYDYPSGVLLSTASSTDSGIFLRLAGGLLVQVSQAVSLGAELGYQPASGRLDNTFHVMGEVAFHL